MRPTGLELRQLRLARERLGRKQCRAEGDEPLETVKGTRPSPYHEDPVVVVVVACSSVSGSNSSSSSSSTSSSGDCLRLGMG